MKRGTPVRLFDLKSNASLNGATGRTRSAWDGSRYSVVLPGGSLVRVAPRNLAPIHSHDFVRLQERLMKEVCVYAGSYTDVSSILHKSPVSELEPLNPALSTGLMYARLSSQSGLLQFFSAQNSPPDVQLMPTECAPAANETIASFELPESDTVTPHSFSPEDELRSLIRVTCCGLEFTYQNLYPRFHLSIDALNSLLTPDLATCLVANLVDVAHFQDAVLFENAVYCAEGRFLLCGESEMNVKVISLQQPATTFKVARCAPALNFRQRVISFVERDDTPPLALCPVVLVGSVVVHRGMEVTVEALKTRDWCMISSELSVHVSALQYTPLSFFHAQMVFARHFLEFLEHSHRVVHGSASQIPPRIAYFRALVDGMYAKLAESTGNARRVWRVEEAMSMLRANPILPSTSNELVLTTSFLNAVIGNSKRYLAWYANMESLSRAVALLFESTDVALELENQHILVVRDKKEIVRVTAGYMDPLEGQRIVFNKEAKNARCSNFSLRSSLLHICHKANTHCAEKDTPSLGIAQKQLVADPKETSEMQAAIARSLRLQEELLAEEELAARKSELRKVKNKQRANRSKKKKAPPAASLQPVDCGSEDSSDLLPDSGAYVRFQSSKESHCRCDHETSKENGNVEQTCSSDAPHGVLEIVPSAQGASGPDTTSDVSVTDDAPSHGIVILKCDSTRIGEIPAKVTTPADDPIVDESGFTVVLKSRALRAARSERDETRLLLHETRDALSAATARAGDAELQARNAELQAQNAELQAQNAELQSQNAERLLREASVEIQTLRKRVALAEESLCAALQRQDEADGRAICAAQSSKTAEETLQQVNNSMVAIEACALQAEEHAASLLSQLERTESQICKAHADTPERDAQILNWVLEKLHKQLLFYGTQPHFKVFPSTMSIACVLRDGFAAKNMIEVYAMISGVSERTVFLELANRFEGSFSIEGDLIHLL